MLLFPSIAITLFGHVSLNYTYDFGNLQGVKKFDEFLLEIVPECVTCDKPVNIH